MPPIFSNDPASLQRRAMRAGAWRFAGFGFAQLVRLGSNLVMTRLLVPEMFGVMAMAMMVAMILNLLSDIGVRQNIVQSTRGSDPVFLDTAWTLQIARGVLLWLAAVLVSVALYIANHGGLIPPGLAYSAPELPLVIAVNSLSAVITGFQSTKVAAAHRDLDQKRLIQMEFAGQVLGTAVMIALGLATHSIWALVAGALTVAFTVTVLSHRWLSGLPNRFRWEKRAARELVHFGRWIFISSAIGVFVFQGDRLLLGGLIEADDMGMYVIAGLFVGVFEVGITRLFATVGLPALSEIARNEPSRLREIYYHMRVPGDLLLLFIAGLLSASGQLVIDLLYDPRYSAAGGMLQVLALRLVVVRYAAAEQVQLALGLSRNVMIVNVVNFVSLFTLIPLLFHFAGPPGAIWGIALYSVATLPFIYHFSGRSGLNNFRLEWLVLPAFPVGYVLGLGANLLRTPLGIQ